MWAQAWAGSRPGPGCGSQGAAGDRDSASRWGQRLSWAELWPGLDWTMAAPDAFPMPGDGTSLDAGPFSGLGEDKAGLLPQPRS